MSVASNPVNNQEILLAQAWAALPASYGIPVVAPTLEEAQAWCRNLAETHYENFHVASWFLPRKLRPHFHAIYAYCRVSDDLGDEVGDRGQSLALLDQWNEELDACYAGHARHPVFVALAETIRICQIPKEPFADLLTAFKQDQTLPATAIWDEVLAYCRYSANPVGRLVLYACGYSDAERFRLSDFTCTALQLANFWQDVASDYHQRDRIYLPQDAMQRFGVTEATIAAGRANAGVSRAAAGSGRLRPVALRTSGIPLIGMVDSELALDLDLFSRGGLEILRAIEQRDYDVLSARPAISKTTKIGLALRAVSASCCPACD
jgi:squalene synthase HpnC